MSTFKRYDEEFKQSLVSTFIKLEKLSLNSVKTMGYPLLRLQNGSNSILEDNSVLTAKQIQELQKRNAQLEEENLILKKASAIFMQNLK
ncbi:transposase [Streptococcus pseudoporcinus]|uniref:Transposase n=1 Tax=Streptococcus pseudoporcinus TaxID=361101 RepID=A0A4U9YFA3_9STRE|nr:transposase [Streptococcus pseudoporcinus]VTS24962.1 transposase [Streptococcus pseudoporcinus]VTS40568.1 transposase [Streptococcus pseudoporcinus]